MPTRAVAALLLDFFSRDSSLPFSTVHRTGSSLLRSRVPVPEPCRTSGSGSSLGPRGLGPRVLVVQRYATPMNALIPGPTPRTATSRCIWRCASSCKSRPQYAGGQSAIALSGWGAFRRDAIGPWSSESRRRSDSEIYRGTGVQLLKYYTVESGLMRNVREHIF